MVKLKMGTDKCASIFLYLWLLMSVLLQALAYLGWPIIFLKPQFYSGDYWQIMTAQWVHLNWKHALLNTTAAIILVLTAGIFNKTRIFIIASLGGMVGVMVVLLVDSTCYGYAGASGFLHGSFSGMMLSFVFEKKNIRLNSLGCLGLILVGVKIFHEQLQLVNPVHPWLNLIVYPESHLAGAIGGCVIILILELRSP